MIRGEHTFIRGAEPDDAVALCRIYNGDQPRATLLDPRREPLWPTVDELIEVLSRQDAATGYFYAVEDSAGEVLGFCSIKGVNTEVGFGEMSVLFLDDQTFDTPVAEETFAFLVERAFRRHRLHKVVAYALDTEPALRNFLLRCGFTVSGRQRDILYSGGRWLGLELLSLFAADAPAVAV